MGNERRKLNGFMLEEYKENVEISRKIQFSEARRDTNQRHNAVTVVDKVESFDYSRYAIQSIRQNKKLKTALTRGLPSGDNTKSPGLLRDLKNQQQRSLLKPVKVSRIALQSPRLPTKISEVAGRRNVSAVSPRLPAPLERLQRLGLSVSVGGQEKPPPVTANESPSPRTTIVKRVFRSPVGTEVKAVSFSASDQINVGTRKILKKVQTNLDKRINIRKQPTPLQAKPSPELANVSNKKIVPPPQGFHSQHKLLLKSQVLAYRMFKRREKLPDVVLKVSTSTNIKQIKLSKTEQRDLKNYFS